MTRSRILGALPGIAARARDVLDAAMGRPTVGERECVRVLLDEGARYRVDVAKMVGALSTEIADARALLGPNPPGLVEGVRAMREALDASRAEVRGWEEQAVIMHRDHDVVFAAERRARIAAEGEAVDAESARAAMSAEANRNHLAALDAAKRRACAEAERDALRPSADDVTAARRHAADLRNGYRMIGSEGQPEVAALLLRLAGIRGAP